MKNDIQIAQEAKLDSIFDIATKLGVEHEELIPYGYNKAKIKPKNPNPNSKLILVTSINPTKSGEGKSTITVALNDGLCKVGKKSVVAMREPSLGPVFGLKGGATGGGYAQVVPMDEINLHFTGDFHAITSANNLISSCIDNHIYQGNELDFDLDKIMWKRCLDLNDRSLREITVGQGSKFNGIERKDGFYITVASEIMAIICLSKDVVDLKNRLNQILIGYNSKGNPIYLEQLGIVGSIVVLLKEAIKPNLVQTLENNPALIHGGPFANIAHGCNSIIATQTALHYGDYVVTEAGFGADLGAEKFLNIKCRAANLKPNAVVIVVTIKALKNHSTNPNSLIALEEGISNLKKHIESIQEFNLPFIIALNKFNSDTKEELELLMNYCTKNKFPISLCEGWEKGSIGTVDLANKVIELCEKPNEFKFLYSLEDSVEEKIRIIATKIYGANGVKYSEKALETLEEIKKNRWDKLPICVAKTPASLSDDPHLIGRPSNFELSVRDFSISLGAGFIVVICGNIMRMPGLPKTPAANSIDLIDDKIIGLY